MDCPNKSLYLIFLARQRNFFISGGPNISYHQLSPVLIKNELNKKIETIRKGLSYSYHGLRGVFRTHFFLGGGPFLDFFWEGRGMSKKKFPSREFLISPKATWKSVLFWKFLALVTHFLLFLQYFYNYTIILFFFLRRFTIIMIETSRKQTKSLNIYFLFS